MRDRLSFALNAKETLEKQQQQQQWQQKQQQQRGGLACLESGYEFILKKASIDRLPPLPRVGGVSCLHGEAFDIPERHKRQRAAHTPETETGDTERLQQQQQEREEKRGSKTETATRMRRHTRL
ncbi:hypothetical protein Emed_004254 [Eimeria media]